MKASATDRKFPTLASKILDIGLVVFITFLEVLQSGIKKNWTQLSCNIGPGDTGIRKDRQTSLPVFFQNC